MPYLTMRGHLLEAVVTQGAALAAATRLDSTAGRAACGELLGEASHLTGDDEAALRHFTDSRALYRRLGDRRGEAVVAAWLAAVAERQGHVAVALGHYEEALRLRPPAAGDKAEEAEMLNNVGWCHALLGDYQQARTFCRRSLALVAGLEPRSLQYHVRDSLGCIEGRLGGFGAAVAHFERALRLCRDYGDLMSEAQILTHLGDACAAAGGLPAAREAWRQACDILDDLGHPRAAEVRAKLAVTAR
jgi:tetratricopeptide (TPR) repeat protein